MASPSPQHEGGGPTSWGWLVPAIAGFFSMVAAWIRAFSSRKDNAPKHDNLLAKISLLEREQRAFQDEMRIAIWRIEDQILRLASTRNSGDRS